MRTALLTVPFGLSAGSVIGAAATRWPAGLDLGRPARSRCDACDRRLGPRELVPVLSWLVQGGQCRGCGARIDGRWPVVELATAGVVVLAVAAPPLEVSLLLAAVGVVLLLAVLLDLDERWIPDRLTLPAGAFVLPAALALSVREGGTMHPRDVLLHGLGVPGALAVVRGIGAAVDGRAWFGGGDVKLLVPVLAAATVIPGGPALVGLGAIGSGGAVAAAGLASGRLTRGSALPFAPFLLIGWCALLLRRLLGDG